MDIAEFDRFADEYYEIHRSNIAITGETPEYFAEYKVKLLMEFVRRNGGPVNRIVDFGAGIGNSVPYFRRYFPTAELIAADVSQRSLEVAQARFPGQFTPMRIGADRVPLADNSVDVVFSACVFHHIHHDEHVGWLGELRRVTRPGGSLTVFEHNPLNPLTVRAVNTCPFDENAHLLRSRRLARFFHEGGWRCLSVKFHVFFPNALRALRPLERRLSLLPLGAQYSVTGRK